ncbi:MAG TPA: type IV pilus secretin PilQ [Thermodesulfobacteriota bacterium]|jgi:type IV pilus assembly protein PilQ|nr:type IV pilus secretin PilQ [Thermodesulfobacteriota bacterium]
MKFLLRAIFIGVCLIGFPLISNSQTTEKSESPAIIKDGASSAIEEPPSIPQAAQPKQPPLTPSSTQPNPVGLNRVESIDFESLDGAGLVTIRTTAPVKYEELPKEKGRFGVRLEGVYLSDELQVSRDVKDFDSPVNFVSSFRDPARESDVILSLELKEDVPSQLEQKGNVITIRIGMTREERKMAEKEEVQVVEEEKPTWAFDFRTATTPGAKKAYRGQLVSFDFKDADIRDVLRILADISGFNIIVSSEVKGTVTLKLSNVPWDQALDVVLEDAGLGAFVEGNVIKVAPLKALQQRQSAMQAAAKSKEQLEPLTTKQVFVNYASAEELVPLAEPLLSERGEIKVDTRTNSLLITDTGARVTQIEELVRSLDTRTPQVLIESRIVQATLDFTRELGVQWGFNYRASAATGNPTGAIFPSSIGVGGVTPGNPGPFGSIGENFIVDLPAAVGTGSGGALGIVLGSITGAYDLDIRLSALENRGDGRVLSSPKVLTLDNIPARIEQGVSIPFLSVSAAGTQTQFVDATLRLEVTPHVTNDGRVLMNIKVTDNAPDPSIVGANGQPAIRRNEAETQVLSIDGETIVIGGIFTRTSTENLNGIPWFSRIPLLGFLFRNTQTVDQRRELLVFITPRIIR